MVGKIDPLVARLLGDVRKSTTVTGVVNSTTDPLTQSFVWQQPTTSKTTFPTMKVDYNVTSKHRLTASFTQNKLLSDPDTPSSARIPGRNSGGSPAGHAPGSPGRR